MDRRKFCVGMIGVPAMAAAARVPIPMMALPASTPAVWDDLGQVRFVLNDSVDHPFYWWPRTLLGYPIQFRSPVDLNRLELRRDDTGEYVPIQFSDVVREHGEVRAATLYFFSDLPSRGRREFVLAVANTPAVVHPQVSERLDGKTIVLDAGPMKVRIPASQEINGDAPGPILQVSRGGKWVGASSLKISGDRITRIAAARVESGPLFIRYELAYESEGGSRYVATVQCSGGLDFIRLQENMEGMRPGAHGIFTSTWIGFDATHRQAPNHPFPLPERVSTYDDYTWELIDQPWHKPDVRFGSSRPIYPEDVPTGQLPITLGIYEPAPGNSSIGTWTNFWAQHSGDALGLFIDKVTDWRDHEYAFEVESPTLQVRYYYRDGKLSSQWPLVRGTRSTCIAFYDHEKDKQAMRQLEQDFLSVQQDGNLYQVPMSFTSHALFLQNRYGTLDLNCVKDWVLDYPASARHPGVLFTGGMVKDAAELERRVMTSPYVCTLPVTGTRQMDGHGPVPGRSIVNFSPVPSRQILGWWIDGFNRFNATMNDRQRARLTAIFLLMGYVQTGDDFMPVAPMLSGHPNYFADVKSAPPAMSFLFPDHPMASTWADMWQTCMGLNTRYNTRPAVETWGANGGRWTEDIGTYVWAFLRPSLHTQFLLRQYDGVQRFVTPQLAEMADWLVTALSAPFDGESEAGFRVLLDVDHGREWGVVGPREGPQRVYPPIGAHSEQRMTPRSLWYLGTCLQRYAPLAAEHAMWAARPASQDAETQPGNVPPWDDIMYRAPDNLGTNPHLRSRKHTGYGIVLRAAVDAKEEVSVHLQQIDEGPNYRWGWAGEGGCGVLYYYAAGKAYSFNGSEDVGDRRDHDTDFCTNFGVFKDGEFRSIGQHVLSRPFYDLGSGQFAEIVPRQGPTTYAAPEYLSRSVLLAGHDYFVLYDAVLNPGVAHRLSWFVRRGDELPAIQFVRPAPGQRASPRTEIKTDATTGVWFDGAGDSMAVVSHRKDLTVEATPYGCLVRAAAIDDMVFRNPEPIHFSDATTSFDGTAGLIRHTQRGVEFALFHGTGIGVAGVLFRTTDTDLGIGGSIVSGQPPRGEYYAPRECTVTVTLTSSSPATRFHIDGEAQAIEAESGAMVVHLKAGRHQWELTDTLPVPIAPSILRTENHRGGALVFLSPVAAATQYRLELSKDNGTSWSAVGTHDGPQMEIRELANGEKVHIRGIASNATHSSVPGPEYPLYVTSDPPLPPEGLHVELSDGAATLTWGEVLGITEYRLYARDVGEGKFHLLYNGRDSVYQDKRLGIKAAVTIPQNSPSSIPGLVEYFVTAVNGNGEGTHSRIADTNPASWRNWDPRPGEPFRRVYSFPPGSPPSPDQWPRYYPK